MTAFLALPGVVAGLVPALIACQDTSRILGGSKSGFVIMGTGLGLLLWCVRDFIVAGRGTLAPWDPPKQLVDAGLYRWVRNPMYIAVVTIVIGWSIATGSVWLAGYGIALAVGFHVRVPYFEEPWLKRQFETKWTEYSNAVNRWLPRFRPRKR